MIRTPEDLQFTFQAIDHIFFSGQCANDGVTIRWGRFRKASRTFCFGDFNEARKAIRINIRLAHQDVPDYVVAAVVYHEALHHIIGLEHSVAFHQAEARFPHFWLAEAWCEKFLDAHFSVDPGS